RVPLWPRGDGPIWSGRSVYRSAPDRPENEVLRRTTPRTCVRTRLRTGSATQGGVRRLAVLVPIRDGEPAGMGEAPLRGDRGDRVAVAPVRGGQILVRGGQPHPAQIAERGGAQVAAEGQLQCPRGDIRGGGDVGHGDVLTQVTLDVGDRAAHGVGVGVPAVGGGRFEHRRGRQRLEHGAGEIVGRGGRGQFAARGGRVGGQVLEVSDDVRQP